MFTHPAWGWKQQEAGLGTWGVGVEGRPPPRLWLDQDHRCPSSYLSGSQGSGKEQGLQSRPSGGWQAHWRKITEAQGHRGPGPEALLEGQVPGRAPALTPRARDLRGLRMFVLDFEDYDLWEICQGASQSPMGTGL